MMVRAWWAAPVLCMLAACGRGGDAAVAPVTAAASAAPTAASGAAGAASAPPVSVSVVRAQRRDVAVQVDATGTVSALATVDIKPQIASVVTAVHVKEGQFVTRGQPLFTLDGRADAANLARVEAQLLRDQAALADAQRQLARAQELLAQRFVSQGAVDTAQANVDGQRAAVAADRAAIDAAKVTVSYSRITAPSSGRVGQINVFAGSSVSPSGAAMVSITQLDPIAVSFNLPQRNLADALKALQAAGPAPVAGRPASAAVAAARPASAASGAGRGTAAAGVALQPGQVEAVLPEGRGTRIGKLDFVDSLVDAASGTVRVKARFANPDQALWPGAYVNVNLSLQSLPGAVVVPQAAIVQGARGTIVYAVQDGKAVPRPIQVLYAQGDDAAVSGVRAGERIVLDGRQNLRPGAAVVERARDAAGKASGAASGAAAGAQGPASMASTAGNNRGTAP